MICQGKTTGVIDVARLSQGATFINKNLFPIIHPLQNILAAYLQQPLYPDPLHTGRVSYGFHFLQWTSSQHDQDWHTLSLEDGLIVLQRLAALEKKLLHESEKFMPPSEIPPLRKLTYGFVSIIKNYGRLAGGSWRTAISKSATAILCPAVFIITGALSSVMRMNASRTTYCVKTQVELQVRDYGTAVLVVPYFMRRPYDMLLVVKDTRRQYLHELTEVEMRAVTQGVRTQCGPCCTSCQNWAGNRRLT